MNEENENTGTLFGPVIGLFISIFIYSQLSDASEFVLNLGSLFAVILISWLLLYLFINTSKEVFSKIGIQKIKRISIILGVTIFSIGIIIEFTDIGNWYFMPSKLSNYYRFMEKHPKSKHLNSCQAKIEEKQRYILDELSKDIECRNMLSYYIFEDLFNNIKMIVSYYLSFHKTIKHRKQVCIPISWII